jgi:hypothetical protein
MTCVFVAGSRAVPRLNSQVRERLDNIIKQSLTVLVGDANGVDKAVQRYLAECGHREVVVYCMEVCRNNVGQWPMRVHSADTGSRHDRHYYGIKDLAMAKDAKCGFMLWDGESKGTLTNVVSLLNAHKKVLLYLAPKKLFFKLSIFEDLHEALRANGIGDAPAFLTSIGIGEPASLDVQFADLR